MKEIKQAERIKRFGLTCTLNNNGVERHFHHGHEYVEIGGIKWATCNVGAEKETDDGKYFAWGETKGFINASKKQFTWEDYEFGNDIISKYNEADEKTVLESVDDAVASAWGNGWRMPTTEEYVALGSAVNTEWIADYQSSGVAGLVCTDKTDESKVLFFPACGFCDGGSVYGVGSHCLYWSSSRLNRYARLTYRLDFCDRYVSWQNYGSRYIGILVRGVAG